MGASRRVVVRGERYGVGKLCWEGQGGFVAVSFDLDPCMRGRGGEMAIVFFL